MVPAQNFLVQGSEVLPENPSVPAGGPAIPRTIDVQEQGPTYLGTQNPLPENSKIINFPKLNFGVLESRHSLLQYWTHRE